MSVHTVLPQFVVSILELTPRKSERHFFWSGEGKLESVVRSWQTRLRKLFLLAPVKGHPHRFRDTLAVAKSHVSIRFVGVLQRFSENLFCILQSLLEKRSNFRSPSGYKHRNGRLESPNVDR